ncbi:MAG: hypothetical protein NTX57_06195 [Armatimonadetes bacterium]|nr:hypothetical protein [Armatimonadota bacterium]
MKSLFLLLHIAIVLCVKPALAQGGPAGGGTSGNAYPCLANVTIENGYRCANNQGVAYNYPQVYKTHLDASNNSIVDHQDPMAAKIGTTLNVTLNVTRSTLAQNNFTGTLTITAEYFTNGGMVSVSCSNITPISNLMPGHSTNVTFSLGALPNYVTKGDLVIFFNGDGYIDGMYEEKLYLLKDQPINCMAIPWVGVLEDSCTWASGESDPLGVITKISHGLYTSQTFFYDSTQTLALATIPANIFDLVQFLCVSDGGGRPIRGQCYDASDYAAICLYSQGRGAYIQYRAGDVPGRQPNDPYGTFLTNLGVLIGHNILSQLEWANHQLVILLNQNISDPTIGLFVPYAVSPAVNVTQTNYWAPSSSSLVAPYELTPVQQGSNIQVTVLGFP